MAVAHVLRPSPLSVRAQTGAYYTLVNTQIYQLTSSCLAGSPVSSPMRQPSLWLSRVGRWELSTVWHNSSSSFTLLGKSLGMFLNAYVVEMIVSVCMCLCNYAMSWIDLQSEITTICLKNSLYFLTKILNLLHAYP